MPVAIENAGIRFPVGYSPWYVYDATVDKDAIIEYMDMMIPTAGVFSRPATEDDQLLFGGYCFALETKTAVTTDDVVLQVAVAGSLVPLVAGEAIQPEGLTKMIIGADPFPQTVGAADGVNIAEGSALGRYRNQNTDAQNLRPAALNDIIYVLTGVL